MRKRLRLALALCAVAAACGTARPDITAKVRPVLDKAYGNVARAFKAKDIKGVLRYRAPGFTLTDGSKVLGAEQLERDLRMQMSMLRTITHVARKLDTLSVKGSTAMATSSAVVEGTLLGNDGKTHKIMITGTSRDNWVKTPKGWLMKSAVVVASKTLLDGHPLNLGPQRAGPAK